MAAILSQPARRLRFDDLPLLRDLTPEQLKELFGAGRFRPGIERLEDRLMMNADINLGNDGFIRVDDIDFSGPVKVGVYSGEQDTYAVQIHDESYTTLLQSESFAQADVKGVFVDGRGADVDVSLGYFVDLPLLFLDADADELKARGTQGADDIAIETSGGDYRVRFRDPATQNVQFERTFDAADLENYLVSMSGHVGDDRLTNTTGLRTEFRDEAGNDTMTGGAGSDTFVGGAGNDSMIGGDGDDRFYGGAGNETMIGGDGDDTMEGGAGKDSMIGGAGNDSMTGGAGNDSMIGGLGDDVLASDAGSDRLEGQAGSDSYFFKSHAYPAVVTIVEAASDAGTDKLSFLTLDAGVTVDLARSDRQTVLAGRLDVTLQNAGAIEILSGTAYDDVLLGDAAANSISGGAGNDSIVGGAGNDTLVGGDGDDTLVGGAGNDSLAGGLGGDRYVFAGTNLGSDFVDEAMENQYAGGRDTFDFTNLVGLLGTQKVGITLDLLSSEVQTVAPAGLQLQIENASERRIENVLGTAYHDYIDATGSYAPLYVEGGAGNDTLIGGRGQDTLLGGAGNDSIQGGSNADALHGGDGDDVIDGGTGNDSIRGDAGRDTIQGGHGGDRIWGGSSSDYVYGFYQNSWYDNDYSNDSLYGEAGNDRLEGGDGHDSLDGGYGNDTLLGGYGNDILRGYSGRDSMLGGSGNDRLFGDWDADTLFGEAGNDKLIGGTGADLLKGGAGADYLDGTFDNALDILDGGNDSDQDTFVRYYLLRRNSAISPYYWSLADYEDALVYKTSLDAVAKVFLNRIHRDSN